MAVRQSPFAYRDFRFFWTARVASMLAQSSLVLSVGWLVYDIARQSMGIKEAAFQLGLIGLAQFLPVLALTPVSGLIVDRLDRRHVVRMAMGLQAVGAALLAWLVAKGDASLVVLFGIAAMMGAVRSFQMPAMNALGPNLVPREILPRSVATIAVAGRLGGILGPVIGGFAFAFAPEAALGMTAVLLAFALGCISMIAPRPAPPATTAVGPWRQVTEGFSYVWTNRLLRGTISLDLFAVLLGGATALLPVFARDILHVGPAGLGYLRGAPALGALLTATWFSWRPIGSRMGQLMLIAVGIFGLSTIGFGLSRWLPLSLLCLTILGASDMVSVVVRQSLMQLHTPDGMRGRVGAISTLSISSSNELGEAESGFLAALVGPVGAVVAGGIGAIGAAVLWARWFPELTRGEPPSRQAFSEQVLPE